MSLGSPSGEGALVVVVVQRQVKGDGQVVAGETEVDPVDSLVDEPPGRPVIEDGEVPGRQPDLYLAFGAGGQRQMSPASELAWRALRLGRVLDVRLHHGGSGTARGVADPGRDHHAGPISAESEPPSSRNDVYDRP